jgi:hypothetical protein
VSVNVVFHVERRFGSPEFSGVRTARFRKTDGLLMVQAALERKVLQVLRDDGLWPPTMAAARTCRSFSSGRSSPADTCSQPATVASSKVAVMSCVRVVLEWDLCRGRER